MTRIALLVVATLSFVAPAFAGSPTAPGFEPVRQDIVDARHQRNPHQRVFLGWTAAGDPVSHVAFCYDQDGGGYGCSIALEVGAISTPLLEIECGDCGNSPNGYVLSVSSERASAAIRLERSMIAKLGTLLPSAPSKFQLWIDSSDNCKLVLRRGDPRVTTSETLGTLLDLGAECSSRGGSDWFWWDAVVVDVQLSPDRKHLFVAAEYSKKSMEYRNPGTRDWVIAPPSAQK